MKKKEDAEFIEWVQKQPSCLSGQFSEILESGEGRCVFAHHRENSGIATKPLFSGYPLTFKEHQNTHQYGLSYYHPIEWWRNQRDSFYRRWNDLNL